MQTRMVIFIALSLAGWILLNQYYRDNYGTEVTGPGSGEEISAETPTEARELAPVGERKRAEGTRQAWTPASSKSVVEKRIKVFTDLYEAEFSSLGGRLVSFRVKRYSDKESGELEGLTRLGAGGEYLALRNREFSDAKINYRVDSQQEYTVFGEESQRIKFYHKDKNGELTKELVIHGDKYAFDVNVALEGQTASYDRVGLSWGPDLGRINKEGRYADKMQAVVLQDGQITEKKLSGDNKEETSGGAVDWIAMKKRYFICLLRAEDPRGYAISYQPAASKEGDADQVITISTAALAKGKSRTASFAVYLGPLEYYRLAGQGHGMERAVTFGFFNSLGVLMLKALHYFHQWSGSWGLAIILLSVLIKIVLWWPTSKSQRSMRHMQETMKKVQPMINALKKKYKDDQQRLSQEQMKLFKEHKINPAGGCLPMLLQMPVFWALYTTLANAIELRGAGFLWMKDLAVGDPLYILPVLMGITSFIQQKASGTSSTATGQQKMMLYFFPLFLTVISVYWPSGLLLYWVVSNVLYIAQIYLINRNWKTA